MVLTPISSSAIRAVGYAGGFLFVVFTTSGTVYSHPGVPYSLYLGLINASSAGAFYNQFIRGKYK